MSAATMTRRIDFNNPTTNKPANLQNSAVLRMLEEEENRTRSGQPGSLKRVAWPPPRDSDLEEFIEQAPVQSQGGPLLSSKSESGSQNNQAPIEQSLTSPVFQQPQQLKPPTTHNTFQPIISPTSASSQSAAQSPYQSAPLSPNINKSPVSFASLAKPWSPQSQSTLQFKSVQPPSLTTVESYQSSKQYHYESQEQIRETQTVVLPPYQPLVQETSFQQYQTPSVIDDQHTYEIIKTQEQKFVPQTKLSDLPESKLPQPVTRSSNFQSSTPIQIQQEIPKSESFKVSREPSKVLQETPEPVSELPLPKPAPTKQLVTPSIQSQTTAAAQGLAQSQAPAPQKYQIPPKQVEPPPSTITLRPQAPVSQVPAPLVTSQPATATLRGGKKLRGDLKWPPEIVKEKMAAEQQHLMDLAKGPACKPRKQRKDYSAFFAQHALNSTYPGYKIPPGTQFYDHNPVM